MDLVVKNGTQIECLKSGWVFTVRGEYLNLQRDINTSFLIHTWKFKTEEEAQEALETVGENIKSKKHYFDVNKVFKNSI